MTVFRDISFLWSMIHIVALMLLLFEPRYSWRSTLLFGFTGAVGMLVFNMMAMLWKGHGIIMGIAFFTCTIPTFILFLVLSKYRDGRYVFLFCLTDTVCFWLLQVTNFLDRIAGDTYLVMLVSRLLVFPLAEFLFWKYLRRPFLELQRKMGRGWWLFAAIGGTYYLLIMFTSVPVGTPMPDLAGLIRILLVLLLMPLTYLTIFHSLWRQIQVFESSQQIELQRRDYSAICQKVEMGRIYRHDMRHHLVALEGMLQQGDSAGAQQYIQELGGKLVTLSQTVWCPHAAINAVLAGYLSQAEDAGCRVEVDVCIPAQMPYGEMDLCILLANTLENAVHACRGVAEGARWIRLKVEMTENSRLTLSVENPCPQPVAIDDSSGLPAVPSEGEHGLGLRSVRSVVDKYGGLLRSQWKDGRFLLRAALFPG